MATDGKAQPLAAIVGRQLRAFREAKGLRQEDVADTARDFGFSWGRSSVAALEGGGRDLDVSELLLLPAVLRSLGGWEEPLLPPDSQIILNGNIHAGGHQIAAFALGLISPTSTHEGDPKRVPTELDAEILGAIEDDPKESTESHRRAIAKAFWIYEYILFALWPDHKPRPPSSRGTEIQRKMAERIQTPHGERIDERLVGVFAEGMWGHNAAEERDARASARGMYETKRALQSARGHVTRELIEEMQLQVVARWPEVQKAYEELDVVLDDPEQLKQWMQQIEYARNRAYDKIAPEMHQWAAEQGHL